jgi:cytochrome c peroxidase
MRRTLSLFALFTAAYAVFASLHIHSVSAASHSGGPDQFHTADRCVACHNGLKTSSGEDISIGLQWRATVMANSARDPYWQGSVRRETIDHPEASAEIQNECSTCHMPAQHLIDKAHDRQTAVLSRLPLRKAH